ncbi:hypothetical protein QLQ12_36760 [Actinoplanes sp. NEAU-A12]|uniref:Uncharacterized protein n=1 Tax=Actinoplanes sandaracinus TaxID=3045177 RepID=A0ABT6WWN1_9ACTN|nr:hypothetical protein [Actinoplanes sandaracinus]MDI6104158.1 hypothetical protein [Actinoplanes sandaracinus]
MGASLVGLIAMSGTTKKATSYGVTLTVLGVMAVVGATSKDVADQLHAPTWVVVACAVAGGVGAVIAGLITYRKTVLQDAETEREIVAALITFLEDRRLLTEEGGYQSHFPDHLRQSAEEIRRRANDALQRIGRRSRLAPPLLQIQVGARNFQEASEGATNGIHSGRPTTPMGLQSYLRACSHYRGDIALGIKNLAEIANVPLDPRFEEAVSEEARAAHDRRAYEEGTQRDHIE